MGPDSFLVPNQAVFDKSVSSVSTDLDRLKFDDMQTKSNTKFDFPASINTSDVNFLERCSALTVKTVETDSPVTSVAVNNQFIAVGMESGRLSFFNHALNRFEESDVEKIDSPCSRINGMQWTGQTSNHLMLVADYIAVYKVDASAH